MFYKDIFGLDISDASIEIIQFRKVRKKIKLIAYGRTELAPGIVKDGKIIHKDKLAKAIKDLLLTTLPKPITTRYLVASLPESKVFTHIFEVPKNLNRKQIRNILNYEAESIIPLDSKGIYWDFKIISQEEKKQEVFYAACSKKNINEFREVFKRADLFPLVFEMESLAVARSLIKPGSIGKDEGILIADIGARTTIISVFDRNGIRSTINIPIAGNKFTEAISQKLEISLKEAERLKRKYGLDIEKVTKLVSKKLKFSQLLKTKKNNEPEKDNEPERAERILLILQSVLQPILEEIKKTIAYYEKKTKRKIKKILLVGGSAAMPKIDSYLADNIGLPVKIGKSWIDINIDSNKVAPILLINAIGLALRGIDKRLNEVDINLLPIEPPETIEKMKAKRFFRWLAKYYVKFSRRFQVLDIREWVLTFKKYRWYLIGFIFALALFITVYLLRSSVDYQTIINFLRPVGNFFQKIFASIMSFLQRFFVALGRFFSAFSKGTGGFFKSAATASRNIFYTIDEKLQTLFGTVAENSRDLFKILLTKIKNFFQFIALFLGTIFQKVGEALNYLGQFICKWCLNIANFILYTIDIVKYYYWYIGLRFILLSID